MKPPVILALAAVTCGLFAARPALSQKLGSEGQGSATAQVVMLSVDGGCAGGIIVGYDQADVYVATAAHINPSSDLAKPVNVLFSNFEVSRPGKFFSQMEPIAAGDLAVVEVARDPAINQLLDTLDFSMLSPLPFQRLNAPVTTIGCYGGAFWTTGQRETLQSSEAGVYQVRSNVDAGQSGGALFNEAWELIGMPLDRGVDQVSARLIDAILADLRRWKVPVLLIPRAMKDRVVGAEELAQKQAATNKALELANESANVSNRGEDLALSHLLAIEALRRARSWSIDHAVRAGMDILPVQHAQFDHGESINSISISPNAQYIATTSGDEYTQGGHVRVWRADGLELTAIRRASPGPVIFSEDSSLIAVGSRNGTLTIIGVPSGAGVVTITADTNALTPMVISPDGRFIVFSARDMAVTGPTAENGVRVWTIAHPHQIFRFDPKSSVMYGRLFIDKSDHLWYLDGGDVNEWDLRAGKYLGRTKVAVQARTPAEQAEYFVSNDFRYRGIVNHTDSAYDGEGVVVDSQNQDRIVAQVAKDVHSIFFSPDDNYIGFELTGGKTEVWRDDVGQLMSEAFVPPPDSSDRFGSSPYHFYMRSYDQPDVFDGATGRRAAWVPGRYPAFSADGHLLAVARDNKAFLVELPVTSALANFRPPCPILPLRGSLALSADSLGVACGKSVYRWTPANGAVVKQASLSRTFLSVGADTNSHRLFAGTESDVIVAAQAGVYDLSNSDKPVLMAPLSANIFDLTESASGKYLAAAAMEPQFGGRGDGGLWLWIRQNGQYSQPFHKLDDPMPHEVVFTPDEACIATTGGFNMEVWGLQGAADAAPYLAAKGGYAESVSFSGDGRYLAAANRDGVQILERSDNKGCDFKLLKKWPFDREVTSAEFAPSGTAIVVSTIGGDQRVMDALTEEQIAARQSPGTGTQKAYSIFGQDSHSIFTVGDDGVSAWRWKTEDFVADACSRLTRNLTPAEWSQYIGDEPFRKTCEGLP